MPSKNNNNPILGQFATFDKKKMAEIVRKANKASVESRRRNKEIRHTLQVILDGKYSVLDANGEDTKLTGTEILALRAFEKAVTPGRDQLKWAEYVRDTAGQKPKDEVEITDTRVVVDIDDSDSNQEENI